MNVKELISELNKKCSDGIRVRVRADGEYYSLRDVEVEYKSNVTETETSNEVFATITTYSNKPSEPDENDPWLGDYTPDYKRLYGNLSQAIVKGFAALENCEDPKISSSECVNNFRAIIKEQYGIDLDRDVRNYIDNEK